MKTFTFPYGTGEWDAEIDVELSDEDAAILEEIMQKDECFHLEDSPALEGIYQTVRDQIFNETKQQMLKDGRMKEAREFAPDACDDDLVDNELGNYKICIPNAFDWMKKG